MLAEVHVPHHYVPPHALGGPMYQYTDTSITYQLNLLWTGFNWKERPRFPLPYTTLLRSWGLINWQGTYRLGSPVLPVFT